MRKVKDTYGEPIILDMDGARVTIRRPILTDEERARRMREIHDAAAALLMSVEAVR